MQPTSGSLASQCFYFSAHTKVPVDSFPTPLVDFSNLSRHFSLNHPVIYCDSAPGFEFLVSEIYGSSCKRNVGIQDVFHQVLAFLFFFFLGGEKGNDELVWLEIRRQLRIYARYWYLLRECAVFSGLLDLFRTPYICIYIYIWHGWTAACRLPGDDGKNKWLIFDV